MEFVGQPWVYLPPGRVDGYDRGSVNHHASRSGEQNPPPAFGVQFPELQGVGLHTTPRSHAIPRSRAQQQAAYTMVYLATAFIS
jgi:hypothetical protein